MESSNLHSQMKRRHTWRALEMHLSTQNLPKTRFACHCNRPSVGAILRSPDAARGMVVAVLKKRTYPLILVRDAFGEDNDGVAMNRYRPKYPRPGNQRGKPRRQELGAVYLAATHFCCGTADKQARPQLIPTGPDTCEPNRRDLRRCFRCLYLLRMTPLSPARSLLQR